MTHPTQIFLSNPQALRVEYRLDDSRLQLWWSPLAGQSSDCADRNYSHRDDHLEIFQEIVLPGCGLESFLRCDYDPYHSVLYFREQTLHLAARPDTAAVFVWGEQPLTVELKTFRHDEILVTEPRLFHVRHPQPRFTFEFAACAGAGEGNIRYSHIFAPENSRYARAELSAGQLFVIGSGLRGESVCARLAEAAQRPGSDHLNETEALLQDIEKNGYTRSNAHPNLEALRRKVIRGLHSMIDESGAFRASLKAIYYLIWVRDAGFAFPFMAAAGWPHKLAELGRLLLDNPTLVDEPGLPRGRMFGQLIHRKYGRLEEDGIFYVVWTLFTHWTQVGHLNFVTPADWALLDEALEWVEQMTWDEARGLYGEHFADETPTVGHRDCGVDFAIGKPVPLAGDGLRWQGQGVTRNYDVYFNLLMHSTYAMLAALKNEPRYLQKAERVWPELERLLKTRNAGIPVYAEQTLEGGARVTVLHWGQASSCCLWGLTLPNFAPLDDWDGVLTATLDAVIANPDMHWINGLCSALAAADPWLYPEEKLLALHQRVAEETERPGTFLPMGGAMPEKFNAPQGNLYHDIRPQGFAMGAWLGAWTALGVRRLPYGLALRPTAAFERIKSYSWRGSTLDIEFGPTGQAVGLEIDGQFMPGTLQLPQNRLKAGETHAIRLIVGPENPLLLRSSVQLDDVERTQSGTCYRFRAFGLAQMTFSAPLPAAALTDSSGNPLPCRWTSNFGLHTCWFEHFGEGKLVMDD